jgi:hypothetical protein
VFEDRVLRSIFGPKRDEVTGSWGKLHDEFHNLYFSINIIMMISLKHFIGRACSTNVRGEGKGINKGTARRPIRRWMNNIKMDLTRRYKEAI